jgi:hypothetical protein
MGLFRPGGPVPLRADLAERLTASFEDRALAGKSLPTFDRDIDIGRD